jgi:competence protein ComGC
MRSVNATFHDNAGLTVVEVVLALAIIMVGLLALIAAMPLGTSQIGEANVKTTATFLAEQRLEQIKNAKWTTAPAVDGLGGGGSDGGAAVAQWPDEGYGSIAFPGSANCAANDRSGGCRFRRQVRIRDCSVLTCAGIATATATVNTLRQVTVTVFFLPFAGTGVEQADEESVQLTTLIAKRP